MDALLESTCFAINQNVDIELLARAYRASRRVQVPNFLSPTDAALLYQHLRKEVAWRTLVVANERQFGTAPYTGVPTPHEEREIFDLAHAGSQTGFAALFDANRPLSNSSEPAEGQADLLERFTDFLNSSSFLEFIRRLTGDFALTRVETQATRFRPGHFVTFHEATRSADDSGRRRVRYVLNLTPQWRPEWGGILEFRLPEGRLIEGFVPCFNALDIFAFPQGHWISSVAAFASAFRYAISGAIYTSH